MDFVLDAEGVRLQQDVSPGMPDGRWREFTVGHKEARRKRQEGSEHRKVSAGAHRLHRGSLLRQGGIEWAARGAFVLILARRGGPIPAVVAARPIASVGAGRKHMFARRLGPVALPGRQSGLRTTQQTGVKAEPARECSGKNRP